MCAHYGIIFTAKTPTGQMGYEKRKESEMESRNGKHRKGNVRMGVYVEPFRKAVAVYLADLADMSMTDIIWQGIERLAISKGVLLPTGEVAPEHKANIDLAIEVVKTSKAKG